LIALVNFPRSECRSLILHERSDERHGEAGKRPDHLELLPLTTPRAGRLNVSKAAPPVPKYRALDSPPNGSEFQPPCRPARIAIIANFPKRVARC
jgi:hypothetical protein